MTRNSESAELVGVTARAGHGRRSLSPTQVRLRLLAAALALLNCAALFLYFSPPGGTRQELEDQIVQMRAQVRAAHLQSAKSETLAAHLEKASDETSSFADKYFLPRRTAYVTVFEEIQRMAKASGIQERDAGLAEEPIEGSSDLTLLNITANYEGPNGNLMKFLNEADRSPTLLILDALTASPQQRNNAINTAIRFQAIIREPALRGPQQ